MAILFFLLLIGFVIGLMVIAGRAFGRSEAAPLIGETFLLVVRAPRGRDDGR